MADGAGKYQAKQSKPKKAPAQSSKGTAVRGRPFPKGKSPNPGGRPKLPEELKAAAKVLSVEALEVLAGIMRNRKAPPAARVRAAESIINRAYGTPQQSVEVTNLNDLPRVIIEAPNAE